MPTDSTTFVLVHGAWHGGWCWRRVSDILGRGHRVFTDAHRARRALPSARPGHQSHHPHHRHRQPPQVGDLNDIVLVGHSYGGSSWGRGRSGPRQDGLDRVPRCVRAGERRQPRRRRFAGGARALRGAQKSDESTIKPIPAAGVSGSTRRTAPGSTAKCTPQPIGSSLDEITLTGARDKITKHTYIRAKGYLERAVRRSTHAQGHASWHMYDMPAATTPWSISPTGSPRF